MTREETIKALELMRAEVEWEYSIEYAEAIDEAIRVLSKTGFWTFDIRTGECYCSHCKLFTLSIDTGSFAYNYCPVCGAKMEVVGNGV